MFQKDNDTSAAICLGIYLLGGLCYTVLLLIGSESAPGYKLRQIAMSWLLFGFKIAG